MGEATRIRSSLVVACAAALPLTLLGCASGGVGSERGSWQASRGRLVLIATAAPIEPRDRGDAEGADLVAAPAGQPVGVLPSDKGGGATGSTLTAVARFGGLARDLLALVNGARREAGVAEVVPDPGAMAFAEAEARRLVEEGAFGHHAADGSKPYQRWAGRGNTARVAENLFRLSAPSRVAAYMLFDPAQAHGRLLRSEGHRRNVLDPLHTGVGIALVFDAARNSVYVVEEFVDRHLAVDPGPRVWAAGQTRELRGAVSSGHDVEPWAAVLYHEPPAGSVAARREARRRSYTEGSGEAVVALSREAFHFDPATGDFTLRARVPPAAPAGSYTLVLYVRPAGPDSGRRRGVLEDAAPASMLSYEVVRD